jgi:hypothetical protein
MQDIQQVKKMLPPFNHKEKVLIEYLFSEYWYSSIEAETKVNPNKMNIVNKYFYLLGMVSPQFW